MSDRGLSDIDKDSWLSSVALKLIPFVLFLFFMVLYGLSVYWSQEPDLLTLNNQKAWRHA